MTRDEILTFCACCPAPCRSAIPPTVGGQSELETPSSLALIARAVLDGDLPFDDHVEGALRNTPAARHAIASCTYGHDVVALIDGVLDELCNRRVSAASTSSPHG